VIDDKGRVIIWSFGFLLFGLVVAVLAIGMFLFSTEGRINPESFMGKKELTEDPDFLFSDKFESKKTAVNGISLGDNESKVKRLGPSSKDKDGWLFTSDGTGYRIHKGKVIEILLSTEQSRKMDLISEREVKAKFGKPDNTERFSSSSDLFYTEKGLIVIIRDEKSGDQAVQVRILSL